MTDPLMFKPPKFEYRLAALPGTPAESSYKVEKTRSNAERFTYIPPPAVVA